MLILYKYMVDRRTNKDGLDVSHIRAQVGMDCQSVDVFASRVPSLQPLANWCRHQPARRQGPRSTHDIDIDDHWPHVRGRGTQHMEKTENNLKARKHPVNECMSSEYHISKCTSANAYKACRKAFCKRFCKCGCLSRTGRVQDSPSASLSP